RLANAKYAHGASSAGLPMPTKAIKDKRAKAKVRQSQLQDAAHALRAQQLEVLMPGQTGFLEAEHEMEHTERMTQQQLAAHVDLQSQRKIFDIALPDFGPYSCAYTRSGRELLLGGRNGHIATFDWKAGKLGCELQVQESVHDVVWLHNETLFAVAQKKSLFIYDNQGIEIHCLRKHVEPRALAFLPYHFLLASIGNQGILRYQDVSTGKLIAECKTHYGACSTMRQNPQNAVLHLGHTNG
ncbi:WD40 repeat-like protein, partial [Caulochytrium protostelioides]